MSLSNYINPKISVIICCYRGEKTIAAALDSLLNQDIESSFFEVIIVDDGSQDKSSTIINNFINIKTTPKTPNFKYFRKKNEGLSIARNFGLKKSLAELVVYIDEDATANKDFLSSIIKFFGNNPKVNCLGGEVKLYNSDVKFARLIQDSIFSLYMKEESSIIGTNMAFRKSFLNDIDGFQPEFTYRGDETALFAKAKDKLVKARCEGMIVNHFQPENRKAWFKTRFKNGFFAIAIDFFMQEPSIIIYKKLIKSALLLMAPILIATGLLLVFVSHMFSLIILLIGIVLFYRKFLWNNLIQDTLKEFKSNRNNKTSWKEQYEIIYLIIGGIYKSNFGYLKGFSKFKNVKWQKK